MPVTIDVRADGLPEHVELAAYFIVSESLTNAGKYAGANAIRIRVERDAARSWSRSPTTAAVAPTPRPAPDCTDWLTGSTRSADGSRSTARPAPEPA